MVQSFYLGFLTFYQFTVFFVSVHSYGGWWDFFFFCRSVFFIFTLGGYSVWLSIIVTCIILMGSLFGLEPSWFFILNSLTP